MLEKLKALQECLSYLVDGDLFNEVTIWMRSFFVPIPGCISTVVVGANEANGQDSLTRGLYSQMGTVRHSLRL